MHTPGPIPAHSLSAVQGRQVLVLVLQMGVEPEQVELSVHCTHAPLGAQVVWPAKLEQSLAPEHLRHVFVFVLQIGVLPEHVLLSVHWTHLFVVVLQTLVEPVQALALVSVHCTQAPLAQAPRAASFSVPHSESPAQPLHLSSLPHRGVGFAQFAADVHCTQLLVLGSQAGVLPVHFAEFASVHWTHAPLDAQAKRSGSFKSTHSDSLPQAWHLSLVPQIGVAPEQFAADVHCTQRLSLASHTGVAPVHAVPFVAVQSTHAPPGAQAPRAASAKPAQSVSAAHAWHLSLVPQMGVAPAQLAAVVHCTQAFTLASQTGVPPVHLVAFVAVHCTQAPLIAHATRAGSPNPAHSVSLAHAWHFSVSAQIGVAPEQLAADVHCTQRLVLRSHAGVAPEHEAPAVHCTHRPSARHAPAARSFAWHCWSVEHPTQEPFMQNDFAGSAHSPADVQAWASAALASILAPSTACASTIGIPSVSAPPTSKP
jgi:hypothetical protein